MDELDYYNSEYMLTGQPLPAIKFAKGEILEFTEDDWKTVHRGSIQHESIYSYFMHSLNYGDRWIAKTNVRKIKN